MWMAQSLRGIINSKNETPLLRSHNFITYIPEMLQQSPLQHEDLQTNTIPLEVTSATNTQTPLHPQTRDPTSHAIATSSVQRSSFVMASPAGAATAASETVATPLTRFNMNLTTSVPQIPGNPEILTQQVIQQTTLKYPHPTQQVPAPISILLIPERAEELLGALTIEQLSLIEKSVQRVKRKKTKETKRLNTNGNNANGVINVDLNNSDLLENPKSNTSKPPILTPNPLPLPVSLGDTISSFVTSSNTNVRTQSQDQHPDQHYQQAKLDHPQHLQQPIQHQLIQSQQNKQIQIHASLSRQDTSQETVPRQNTNDINNPTPNHALPATDPIIVMHEGVHWVVFTYSVKGNNKEYRIRIDIESINLDIIDEKFRRENCLYPRANCTEDKYKGNRWSYEKECNELGWKLAWLNKEEIGNRRGLLQRAVDSYRNRDPSLRSRRVVRNEKIQNGTLRKRITRDSDGNDGSPESSAKRPRGAGRQLTIESTVKGEVSKIRIRADIECVSISEIPDDYKRDNCVYPKALAEKADYQGSNWELESSCNELGWKLAFLNRPKLDGKKLLLQKAIELYREKYNKAVRPRRGRYSHTLSAKFFENHPREVDPDNNYTTPSTIENKMATSDTTNTSISSTLSNPEPRTSSLTASDSNSNSNSNVGSAHMEISVED
ncbi:16510_t:CDS:2 [Acaulospora morrowiae]|uniref:16510_t:CDS:1 n=1 Tax=Acaulospora morrowiae TaxID=94023 RepID=A0A9N9I9S1_9GLOM|nr:16510_t:CDS:2 [Acaulospora morrowiae]